MSDTFATASWTDRLATALTDSTALRTAAVDWVFGPITFVADASADPAVDAAAFTVDLHAGACRGAAPVAVDGAARMPFVLGGSLARWKSVFAGELAIVDAVLDSKLRFAGDLPVVVRHRDLFAALAAAGAGLDTAWPQDAVAEPANA